jgi:hypothetical protein
VEIYIQLALLPLGLLSSCIFRGQIGEEEFGLGGGLIAVVADLFTPWGV